MRAVKFRGQLYEANLHEYCIKEMRHELCGDDFLAWRKLYVRISESAEPIEFGWIDNDRIFQPENEEAHSVSLNLYFRP